MEKIDKLLTRLAAIATILSLILALINYPAIKCWLSKCQSDNPAPVISTCTDNQCSTNQAIELKKQYEVGGIIKFGSYPYETDGTEKAIEWQILEKYTDGTALVISKYALDNVEYNGTNTSVTWETSSIRKWLNNDFYNKAFRNADKSLIVESYLENKDNAEYDTKGGNNTYDKMFLLSIDEAEKYFGSNEKRKLWPTHYAKSSNSKNGKLRTDADYGGSCWWWLRSPGYYQSLAAFVGLDGYVYSLGRYVLNDDGAVRVAFKVNLKNL